VIIHQFFELKLEMQKLKKMQKKKNKENVFSEFEINFTLLFSIAEFSCFFNILTSWS